jgi:hypothetical protein
MFTTHAPALCWGADRFWMAWKGSVDENIWLANSPQGIQRSDHSHYADPIDGHCLINTIACPGPAVWQHGLMVVWRGATHDQALWWSTLSKQPNKDLDLAAHWQTPQILDPVDNSHAGPNLGSRSIMTVERVPRRDNPAFDRAANDDGANWSPTNASRRCVDRVQR